MPLTNAPDLTKRAPRSARVRLGGYVILPRMLDKGRATIAGTNGDYHYDCPMDQRFLSFVGVDAAALKEQLATGAGDGEILNWIIANGKHPRTDGEIRSWTETATERTPGDPESRTYFNDIQVKCAPLREDICTWFDLLDADDHVSYGGAA